MIPNPQTWSVSTKIALSISLAVIAGATIAGILVQTTIYTAHLARVQDDFEALSTAQLQRIVEILTREVSLLVSLSHDEELLAAIQAGGGMGTSARLETFTETFPQFRAVVLTDQYGLIVAASYPSTVIDLHGVPWWGPAYAGSEGAVYISDPVTDRASDTTGVQIALPIYDETGTVIGVMMAVWDFDLMRQALIIGAPERTAVLDVGDEVVLADTAAMEEMTPFALPEEMVNQLSAEAAGAFVAADEEGRPTVFGYTNLSAWSSSQPLVGDLELGDSLRSLGWSIVVREPVADAVHGVAPMVQQVHALIGGSAAAAIVLALAISHGALLPLRRLSEAAARVARGEADVPIPELPRDEVGQLADVLREMVARLARRVEQLRGAAQISHTVTLSLEVDWILNAALGALVNQFGYPESRVYLVDSVGRQARIWAAVGEEGERLLTGHYSVPVDESTLVGRAILLDEPQLGVGKATLHSKGQVVEHSEMAIPLHVAERSLGVLYVAAARREAFDPGDVDVLSLIADQLSAALENARLFEQTRAAMAEIEALNRRLTRVAWEEHLTEGGTLRHTLDPEARWPASLEEARRRGSVIAESYIDQDGRSVLAAPIVLRGEAIGTIGVTRPSGHLWSQDEIALVEAIATRVAMLAEGIRLVDESTRAARREQVISAVSERLQRAVDVDSVVLTALDQLGGAFGSEQISLRIGPPPVDSDRRLTSSQQDGDEREGEEGASSDDE